jgi:hypothetical protein
MKHGTAVILKFLVKELLIFMPAAAIKFGTLIHLQKCFRLPIQIQVIKTTCSAADIFKHESIS